MAELKSVLVAGGTGFIGSALCSRLESAGCSVTVVTRLARRDQGLRRYVAWAPEDPESAAVVLASEVEKAAAVVNLAGEPVAAGRWTEAAKRRILESRLRTTRSLVRAIDRARTKPGVLVNASAVGYYGNRPEGVVGEDAPAGRDFLADVCRRWEEEALKASAFGCRVALLRIGVALGLGGGALPRMLPSFRMGVGGPLGSGDQPMSWIHVEDLAGMIQWLVETPSVSGAFNGTAPHPLTNREFSKTLARVLGRPCLFKVPAFVLRAALGEMSSILLGGQYAPPKAALSGGFSFRYPDLEGALRGILKK